MLIAAPSASSRAACRRDHVWIVPYRAPAPSHGRKDGCPPRSGSSARSILILAPHPDRPASSAAASPASSSSPHGCWRSSPSTRWVAGQADRDGGVAVVRGIADIVCFGGFFTLGHVRSCDCGPGCPARTRFLLAGAASLRAAIVAAVVAPTTDNVVNNSYVLLGLVGLGVAVRDAGVWRTTSDTSERSPRSDRSWAGSHAARCPSTCGTRSRSSSPSISSGAPSSLAQYVILSAVFVVLLAGRSSPPSVRSNHSAPDAPMQRRAESALVPILARSVPATRAHRRRRPRCFPDLHRVRRAADTVAAAARSWASRRDRAPRSPTPTPTTMTDGGSIRAEQAR